MILAPGVFIVAAFLPPISLIGGLVGGAIHGFSQEAGGTRKVLSALAKFVLQFHGQFVPNLIDFIPQARQPISMSRSMKMPEGTTVGVVAAGPAGIAAARSLNEKGYHVTVFESRSGPGGKAQTLYYQENAYDKGPFLVIGPYLEIKKLAESVGMRTKPTNPMTYYSLGNRRLMNPTDTAPLTTLARDLARYIWLMLTDFNALVRRPGYEAVHPDLAMPLDQFLKEKNLEAFAQFFRPFYTGFWYGYFEEVPALYFMRLLNLKQIFNWGYWLEWEGGYHELFERLAALPGPEFKYNAAVRQVQREEEKVTITTDEGSFEFDQLVVAAPLDAAKDFMDLAPEERELFEKVDTFKGRVYFLKVDGLPSPGTTFILEHMRSDKKGHVLFWEDENPQENLVAFYVLADEDLSTESALEVIKQDIDRLGGRYEGFVDEVRVDYFPHVKSQDVRDGFFRKLEALQGLRRTAYVGSTLNVETVNDAVAQALHMIERLF